MTPGQLRSLAAPTALLAAFGASRLVHLTLLPMFIDEAVYLHWARRVAMEGRLWRPLADGKSLQVALLAALVPWVRDPLFWGRLVSVAAGALGMLAAWAIARRLHGPRAGLYAAALYVLSPFALFHDRMVLADVFLSTAAALSLLASIALAEAPTRRRGVLVGLALTACVLSKIPGLLVFAIPALTAVLLPRRPGIFRALALAYGVAALLVFFPVAYFFQNSAQVMEQAAVGEEGELLGAVVGANLSTVAGWMWVYWTPGVSAVGLVALAAGIAYREKAAVLLGACALIPIVAFALLSRSWFPRYVFLSTIPLLVLVAIALSRFTAQMAHLARSRGAWRAAPMAALVAVALAWPAVAFDRLLLGDPARAPFPEVDRFQYVDGWTAGYGRTETARRLRMELGRNPVGILVGVSGAEKHGWRPLFLLLRAWLMNEPRVELQVMDAADPVAREALRRRAGARGAFLAVAVEGGSVLVPGVPVLQDARADGTLCTALYRLLPPEGAARE